MALNPRSWSVFLSGWLLDKAIQDLFLPDARVASATLQGFEERLMQSRAFPALVRCKGVSVEGIMVEGMTDKTLEKLAFYFDKQMFDQSEVTVQIGESSKHAVVFLPKSGIAVSNNPWQLTKTEPYQRRAALHVARDVSVIYENQVASNTPLFHAGLEMRGLSAARAGMPYTPSDTRRGFSRDDVQVKSRSLPYARYFDVEDVTLRHQRFDGGMSAEIERTVMRSADAVTVLPYDPILDQVVLVEQFRPAAFVRGDNNPWVLEPIAGRCDSDESVETVARREAQEEAGLSLLSLEKIGNYYPSPGCLSEYLYSFLGVVDLSKSKASVHGLDAEGEDIQTHFLSYEQAMHLIETGEAENGPLLLSLMWLTANRNRLRADAAA